MHDTGHPKPVLWDNPEGYGREGGGRGGSGSGGHVNPYGQFMLMYDKNITILKSNYPPIKIN